MSSKSIFVVMLICVPLVVCCSEFDFYSKCVFFVTSFKHVPSRRGQIIIYFINAFKTAIMADTILGVDIPFERLDLVAALVAVVVFLPVVVIVHTIVTKTYSLLTGNQQKHKTH